MSITQDLRFTPPQIESVEISFGDDDGDGVLTLYLYAVCEDTYHPGEMLTIVHPTKVPPELDLDDNAHMIAFIRQCLILMLAHEVDEGLRYNGKLVRDPHAMEYVLTEAASEYLTSYDHVDNTPLGYETETISG